MTLAEDTKQNSFSQPPNPNDADYDRQRRGRLLAVLALCLFFVLANEVFMSHTTYSGTREVEISQGLGSRKIGALLKKEGVIRSKWAFVTYVSLIGKASSLKPGTYTFSNDSISKIARDLIHGANYERTITIPEGWSNREIADYLEKEGVVSAEKFLGAVGPEAKKRLKPLFGLFDQMPKRQGLEGLLFPDTYRIFNNAQTEEIVDKLYGNFYEKLYHEFSIVIVRPRNMYEYIIMASLIEREVVSEEDRRLVPGILWKRLDAGIPLQIDATLVYIKNQESGVRNQGNTISAKDKKTDSPYNTYLYRGLPAGPISNPGLSAIKAAISPKESPYFYYLSTPDGRTIFSQTLEEHNLAKAKYLSR